MSDRLQFVVYQLGRAFVELTDELNFVEHQ